MARVFRKKRSEKPQMQPQQQQEQAPPPAAPWSLPADWREQLTATRPKGRFKQGENTGGYRR